MTAPLRQPAPTVHPLTRPAEGLRLGAEASDAALFELAEEVPVAMVFDGSSVAVMMASPADIEDFALGFALTEGFITTPTDIREFEVVAHDSGLEARFWLHSAQSEVLARRRRALAGPIGCGLCGLDSLDQALRDLPNLSHVSLSLTDAEVIAATDMLRAHQPLHDLSHASHAAGFLLPGQGIVMAREDVGRHNALDKLIGALVRSGQDPAQGAFVMTSRISVDLVQKAALSGCSTVIAVSAPTAHAVRVADHAGLTLAAQTRGGRSTVFCHDHRIA